MGLLASQKTCRLLMHHQCAAVFGSQIRRNTCRGPRRSAPCPKRIHCASKIAKSRKKQLLQTVRRWLRASVLLHFLAESVWGQLQSKGRVRGPPGHSWRLWGTMIRTGYRRPCKLSWPARPRQEEGSFPRHPKS